MVSPRLNDTLNSISFGTVMSAWLSLVPRLRPEIIVVGYRVGETGIFEILFTVGEVHEPPSVRWPRPESVCRFLGADSLPVIG